MMLKLLIILVLFLPSAGIRAQHMPPPAAKDEVDLGLKAHRSSHFAEATQHFQRALAIDKNFCWARLYLASSFGAEYVPHVDSADNLAMGKQALEHYEAAMKCDPSLRTTSLIGMSYLTMLMEKYPEARDLYRQLLNIDIEEGNVRDTYVAMGSSGISGCDLQEAIANTSAEKVRLGLKPDQSLADDPACPSLRKRNLPLLEEGLQMLSKTMLLRPSYEGGDQVTASVFYDQRAEIECGDPAARKADKENAAYWENLAIKISTKARDAAKK